MKGYRNSPVVLEGVQRNVTPGANSSIDNVPEGVDDGTIGTSMALCVVSPYCVYA